MIKFIYGNSFGARTEAIMKMLKEDAKEKRKSFLIIPEQFAVAAERLSLTELPLSAQLYLEILSFSRLYNRVCRKYGGIHYNYVTKPVKYALMWKNLRELSPHLETYGEVARKDAAFCDMALAAVGEFKSKCITAADLEDAATVLPDDTPLPQKLRDLALIYAAYSGLVSQTFTDSADDIAKLADVLDEHSFFEGANVYIDAFSSFTAAEHRVIERMFSSAANVTVSIPMPSPDYTSLFSDSIVDSRDRLQKTAEKYSPAKEEVILDERTKEDAQKGKSLQKESIKYFSDNLFTAAKNSSAPTDKTGVYPVSCSTVYTEAEATARIILGLLRKGYRLRDIVVIARDAEQYRGIIEPALEKCDIPYYFSEKTDLSATPLVKFILSALRVKLFGWQTADVISHIKTGIYGFDTRETDLFEQYITSWKVRGKTFTEGDFTMNPDGYVEELTPRAKAILDAANSVRWQLTGALCEFFDAIDASDDVTGKCRAVYDFISKTGAESRLNALSKKERERGNVRAAEEYSKIFPLCCDALGELASSMQNELESTEVDTAAFCELLTLFFSKCEMGTIPTSSDQVIVGSAKELRTDRPKVAILLGLCEGIFPATVSDRGVLSIAEKNTLFELGGKFAEVREFAASDELMYLARAASSPSDELWLLTHTSTATGARATPSLPFLRAKELFSQNFISYNSRDLLTLTPSLYGALPYLRTTTGTPEGEALAACAAQSEDLSRLLGLAGLPVSDPNCHIDPEIAKTVFKDGMRMSQSRLDKFIKCHFDYYCENVLKLREEKENRFEANNIGSFVHFVLEKMIDLIVNEKGIKTNLSRNEIETSVRAFVDEYIKKITPEGTKVSARLKHLYMKLYNISLILVSNIIEEFRHSSFRPEFFELETNGKGDNPSPREFILSDGSRVVFSGVIDRVDVYRAEGGKVYIRVVDYKTGTKSFSLSDIKQGLNIQMLLYLFTLIRNNNPRFNEKLGKEILPAGVVYLSSSVPILNLAEHESDDDVIKNVQNNFKRSGILIDDEEVLTAVNDELSPKFLGSTTKKRDGTLTGSLRASLEGFAELEKEIEDTVCRIADEMRSGNASAAPLVHAKNLPCTYCDMRPICRHIPDKNRFNTDDGEEE